jgi:hypothetical protein
MRFKIELKTNLIKCIFKMHFSKMHLKCVFKTHLKMHDASKKHLKMHKYGLPVMVQSTLKPPVAVVVNKKLSKIFHK